MRDETIAIHLGYDSQPTTHAVAVPRRSSEERVARLERGGIAALALSSGSAAVNYSILNLTVAGDNVVSVPQLYGGTYTLFAHMLPQQGIEVRFAEGDSPDDLVKLIDGRTKAIFCESIGNPTASSTPRRWVRRPTSAGRAPCRFATLVRPSRRSTRSRSCRASRP